jgi:hypothetical protein
MPASIPVTFELLTLARDRRVIHLKGDRRFWLETLIRSGHLETDTPLTPDTQLVCASLTDEGREFLIWLHE